jgi:hypothetical protein
MQNGIYTVNYSLMQPQAASKRTDVVPSDKVQKRSFGKQHPIIPPQPQNSLPQQVMSQPVIPPPSVQLQTADEKAAADHPWDAILLGNVGARSDRKSMLMHSTTAER